MKNILLILVSVVLVAFITIFFMGNGVETNLSTQNKNIALVGEAEIEIEIVSTRMARGLGLSGRESLGENKGMLFVFVAPDIYPFWMKDMFFSIDIVWVDENLNVVGFTKNLSPDTYPETFNPPSPVKYVLEANAGWADKHNIKVGDVVSY